MTTRIAYRDNSSMSLLNKDKSRTSTSGTRHRFADYMGKFGADGDMDWSSWEPVSGIVAFGLLMFSGLLFGCALSNIVAPVEFASVSTFRWVALAFAITMSVAAVFYTLLMIFNSRQSYVVTQRAMLQLSFTPLFWILYFMLAEYYSVIGKSRDSFDFYAICHFGLAISSFHFAGLMYSSNPEARMEPGKNSAFVVVVYALMIATLFFAIAVAFVSFAQLIGSDSASARTLWILTVVLFGVLVLTVFVNAISPGTSRATGLYSVVASVAVLVGPLILSIETDFDDDASYRIAPLIRGAAPIPFTEGAPWLVIVGMTSVAWFFVAMAVSFPVVRGFSREAKAGIREESGWVYAEMALAIGSAATAIFVCGFSVVSFVPGNTNGITPQTIFWVMLSKMIWDIALLVTAIIGAIQHKTVRHHMERIWMSMLVAIFSAIIFWAISHWWSNNSGNDTTSAQWKANALFNGMYNLLAATAAGTIVYTADAERRIASKEP